MTTQETIERDVRIAIGDLHVQLIVARARIAELEAMIPQPQLPEPEQPPVSKSNGRAREATQ